MKQIILHVALPTPMRALFDYLPPKKTKNGDYDFLKPGTRVQVPFQSRQLIGILVKVDSHTAVPAKKLKQVDKVLDNCNIFSEDVYELCHWASLYYQHALGEVFATALPPPLRKGHPLVGGEEEKASPAEPTAANVKLPTLNAAQKIAYENITALSGFNVFLLEGVTGSGKTEVYLRVITEVLRKNQQVLVLVPEINLTPQTIARFQERFAVPVVALHSNLTDKKRFAAWCAARAGCAKIVIGTRSAIFTPMPDLGLIVVDEEHDLSFKQQDRFRYHGRDLAIKRASLKHIPVILGSATPALETLLNVRRKKYHYLNLPERAGNASLPDFHLIDLCQHRSKDGLSAPLITAMQQQLAQENQIMLFLNRRGFAPVLYCTQCAWIMKCEQCDIPMVMHHKPLSLQCHHCDTKRMPLANCPECQNDQLQAIGLGTQRIEQEIKKLFPSTPIIRVDRDNTQRKDAIKGILAEIAANKSAILVGTQMLAKGHHFPQVTLVGVIDMDQSLFSVNFRAAEQMGQLLLQVAGRAGRGDKKGQVMIQTHHPQHALIQQLIAEGYQPFSQTILQERDQAQLPPYTYFAVFRAQAKQAEKSLSFLTKVKQLYTQGIADIQVMGPVPALMPKKKGLYHHHLLIKTCHRQKLQQFLTDKINHIEAVAKTENVRFILDIDPIEI